MKKKLIKLVDDQLIDMWNDIVILISAIEPEVVKNSQGNVQAGIKLRTLLEQMKKKTKDIKKRSLEVDKQRRLKRLEAKYLFNKEV